MNKPWVLFHLREALEEIEATIKDIEEEPEYDGPEFSVAIAHLYHHVNTAWNSRHSTAEDALESSVMNFERWRQFPTDVDMSCQSHIIGACSRTSKRLRLLSAA